MSSFEQASSSFLNSDSVQIVAPASGTTVVMAAAARCLYVNNNALLAALTIRLPKGPAHGQLVELAFANDVTTVTIQDGLGHAVSGPPSGVPNSAQHYKYLDTRYGAGVVIKSWVYWK